MERTTTRSLGPTDSTRVKRALVVEGGGMRSAYVAGALLALHEVGPRQFDVIIGTSAGACCAANFIAGRPEFNQFVLEEHLASDRFIQYKNIPTKKNVVDVDFLMDECFATLPRLQEELAKGKVKFLITSTNCETGKTIFYDAAKQDVREALRASCAMPYFYRRKLYHQGDRVMDGGLTSSIPIQRAIDEGCTEIYVVCSRPVGYRKKPNPWGWINHVFFPRYPQMAKVIWERYRFYNRDLDLVENPPPGIRVIAIRPQHKLPVSRVTRDKIRVRQGIQQGFYDAYQVLTGRHFVAPEKIKASLESLPG